MINPRAPQLLSVSNPYVLTIESHAASLGYCLAFKETKEVMEIRDSMAVGVAAQSPSSSFHCYTPC